MIRLVLAVFAAGLPWPLSRIGHLNVLKGLRLVRLGEQARIGRNNWIYGFPAAHPRHFTHFAGRDPSLLMGAHAAITHRHLIDCTETVTVGEYSTIAGHGNQVLSHSIDIYRGCQHADPVTIDRYCFVGTDCCILGGAALPDFCVLAAKSLLRVAHQSTHRVYAGVPSREVAKLPEDAGYFTRSCGFVD